MCSSLRTVKFQKRDFAAVILMVVLCVGALLQWWMCPLTMELGRSIENPYFSVMDSDGNYYVINAGKAEILKIAGKEHRVEARMSWETHEEDTFGEADEMAVDAEGNIYVLDVLWNDTGLGLAAERVLQFDSKGHFQAVVFEKDYADVMVMKRHLFSLRADAEGIVFAAIETGEDKINVYSYSVDMEAVQVECEIENVENVEDIQDISYYDPQNVFYVTKSGEILKTDGSQIESLYKIADGEFVLPYNISCDSQRNLYFTDICNQEIYIIRTDGIVEKCYDVLQLEAASGIDRSGAIMETLQCVMVDGEEYLCVTCDNGVMMIHAADGVVVTFDELPYAAKLQAGLIGRFIAAAIAGIIAIYYLLVMVRILIISGIMKKKNATIMLILGISISALVVMFSLLARFKDNFIEEQISSMCTVTQIASAIIDPDVLAKVNYPSDYGSPEYMELQKDMEKLIDVSSVYSENLYCNLVKMTEGRCYAIAYLDNSIGAFYPLDGGESEEASWVYESGERYINNGKSDATGSYVYVKNPILDENQRVIGIVEIGMVSDTLAEMVGDMRNRMVVNILLMIIIAVFLVNEAYAYIDDHKVWKERTKQESRTFPVSYLRIITFFCFASYNMPTSFLPVYVEKFYTDGLYISKELAGSLPLTVNFAMIGFMSIFCAKLLRKFGFQKMMIAGALVCLGGDLTMAFSANYFMAAGGLLLNGVGCGLVMNGLSIIVANQNEEDKTKGFAVINGAILSGMITGTVVGAALAERLGYAKMFFCSAGIWVAVSLLLFLTGKAFVMTDVLTKVKQSKKLSLVFSGNIMGYLILVVVPFTVVNGFTSYFLPVFADSYGLSESQTSLFLVMNCLVGIFLSETLTSVTMKYLGRGSIYLSGLLSIGAILLFGYFENMYMLAFALFLLGTAKSFGSTSREILFCGQPAVQKYGEDMAMGYYNLADNVGESLGTVVFGEIMTIGFLSGMWMLGGAMVVLTGIFELVTGRKLKK